jgi:hypothetical protein
MLYRRGENWHYDFTVAGRRQRGTTRQTSESRARRVESKLMEEAERRDHRRCCGEHLCSAISHPGFSTGSIVVDIWLRNHVATTAWDGIRFGAHR